ncbi:MAG: hypothetical protein LBV51_02005 [Acholeplasmatales bacterium]|jgi:hypothetical protein|nr:hypothetical protein [Acholeplasmatales bacterium]
MELEQTTEETATEEEALIINGLNPTTSEACIKNLLRSNKASDYKSLMNGTYFDENFKRLLLKDQIEIYQKRLFAILTYFSGGKPLMVSEIASKSKLFENNTNVKELSDNFVKNYMENFKSYINNKPPVQEEVKEKPNTN